MNKVKIGKKWVGEGAATYIIAEVGSNHDCKLAQAKKIIEAAASAEVDAVKFQLFKAETIAAQTKDKIVILDGGKTLYDLYKQNELPREWLGELFDYTVAHGIDFLATPFDEEAVDLIDNLAVNAHKISSFEIVDLPLVQHAAAKGKPVIISTGMANLGEIEDAINAVRSQNNDNIALLHCGISYPLNYSDVNLLAMKTIKQAFPYPVGYSDHTLGISIPVAAVALGASLIEKHFTIDRALPGPDHKFALEPKELTQMVKSIRQVEQALGSGEKSLTETERIHFQRGRRSVFAKVNINKGTTIQRGMLAILRPGIGLAPKFIDIVVGRKAQVDIAKDEPITWNKI
jgi:pseudaminic acid synthase